MTQNRTGTTTSETHTIILYKEQKGIPLLVGVSYAMDQVQLGSEVWELYLE